MLANLRNCIWFSIDFNVYPNPSSDLITLDIESTDKLSTAYIYDALGQVVKMQGLDNTNQIGVSELNNGLYFIFINGQKKYQASFVKE